MKALIWILCFFVATILNTLLGYATGIKVGYLIFYFVVFFVAEKLCDKWDKYSISQKAQREGKTPFEYIKDKVPKGVMNKCATMLGEEAELRKYLNKCANYRKIKRGYVDIVYGEYAWVRKPHTYFTYEKSENNSIDKVSFCRKCGEPLIDNSKFCRKCGTKIANEE